MIHDEPTLLLHALQPAALTASHLRVIGIGSRQRDDDAMVDGVPAVIPVHDLQGGRKCVRSGVKGGGGDDAVVDGVPAVAPVHDLQGGRAEEPCP